MRTLLGRDVPPRATLLVLVLVLVAGIVTGGEKSAPPEALVKQAARPPAVEVAQAENEADVQIPLRQAGERTGTDLFASHSWVPKPPPPPPPAPVIVPQPVAPKVEPPSAPPLPFRYLGQLESRSQAIVFLVRVDGVILAAAGETIDNVYRIEAITESAVEFLYLPLGVRQSLAIPSVAERGG